MNSKNATPLLQALAENVSGIINVDSIRSAISVSESPRQAARKLLRLGIRPSTLKRELREISRKSLPDGMKSYIMRLRFYLAWPLFWRIVLYGLVDGLKAFRSWKITPV